MNKSLALLALLFSLVALAACTSIEKKPIFADDNGALRGYDPVSYFDLEQAVKGNREISHEYAGAIFYFTSQANQRRFIDNPAEFLPQYGGYCAYGMSRNFVVSSDPTAFNLVDGKLYLNYSHGVRTTWLKDVRGNIEKADANWTEKLDSNKPIKE